MTLNFKYKSPAIRNRGYRGKTCLRRTIAQLFVACGGFVSRQRMKQR
ncbi:hypothetical protein [Nostoc sp.]